MLRPILPDATDQIVTRAVAILGPLGPSGQPLAGPGLSCDPGTGGGQCLRMRIATHRREPPEPFGWEAGEGERAADRAWWRLLGHRLGGLALDPDATEGDMLDAVGVVLDVDAALPDRGAWTP